MKQLPLAIVLLSFAGCGLMPSKEPAKTDFDFGPLGAYPPKTTRSSDVDIVVHDITSPAWMDNSLMYYRLAYRNATNPLPYAQSEWVMSPAGLLTQRLRARLAMPVSARSSTVYTLRSELVEFEQVFDQPGHSRGVLRVRAKLEGAGVQAQRTFVIEKPAPTADAPGGVSALTQCSDELAESISEWVAGSGRSAEPQTATSDTSPKT